jgi:hypothetical protein
MILPEIAARFLVRAQGLVGLRICVLALGICLAGCAAGIQNLPDSPLSGDTSEPNYRQILADEIGTIFPDDPAALGVLELSGVRPVSHLRGLAWLTCLRIHAEDAAQEYAVFILGDKIIDVRIGVAIDRCRQQTYATFDLASFMQPKIPPKMQAKKATR